MWGGLSRSALARKLDCTEGAIRSWERARLLCPTANGRPGVPVEFDSAQVIRAKAIRFLTGEGALLSEIREALGAVGAER